MNADGSGQTRLTNNAAERRDAGLVARRHQDRLQRATATATHEIYTMNADGTGQTRLTNNAGRRLQPAWSPDGTKIAFDERPRRQLRDLHDERRRHEPDRLTNNAADDSTPAWSPDGDEDRVRDATATATPRSTR